MTITGLKSLLKAKFSHLSKDTAANYIANVSNLATAAGFSKDSSSHVLVSELLQQQHIKRYLEHMHQHNSAATIQQYSGRLRKVLSFEQVQAQLAQGVAQQLISLLSGQQPASEGGAPAEPAAAQPAPAEPPAAAPAEPAAAAGKGRRKRRSAADAVMEDAPVVKDAVVKESHPVQVPADAAADSDDDGRGSLNAAAAAAVTVGRRQRHRLQLQLPCTQPEAAAPKGAALPPPSPAEAAAQAEAEAAAAAAARAASATAVMMAEESLPDVFAPLQPSADQKRQFYRLMPALAELWPGDIRLDKFWCDEDVSNTAGVRTCLKIYMQPYV
jgi:hypothetical protein